MNVFFDLSGQRFGAWYVDTLASRPPAAWNCICGCGARRVVLANSLRSGRSTNCGCLQYAALSARQYKHGHSKKGRETPEYHAWKHIIQRCGNPARWDFKYYGGRGIKVCERWSSFKNFLTDMGSRPSPELTLDRIDVDGDYEPRNCRWATRKEQTANRRPFKQIFLRGADAGQAKLSWDDIREIRALVGSMSQRLIGERFGVSQSNVSQIVREVTWR